MSFIAFTGLTRPVCRVRVAFGRVHVVRERVDYDGDGTPHRFADLQDAVSVSCFGGDDRNAQVATRGSGLVSFFCVGVRVVRRCRAIFDFHARTKCFRGLVTQFAVQDGSSAKVFAKQQLGFVCVRFFRRLLSTNYLLTLDRVNAGAASGFFRLFLLLFDFDLLILLLTGYRLA